MKRLLNIHEELSLFWENNQKQLILDYPGFNLHILLTTFIEFANLECSPDYLKTLCYNSQYNSFKQQMEKGVPISYFLKNRYFYNSHFFVSNDVLIPRFETEILVEESLKLISAIKKTPLKIVEVGVGSGNILISILAELGEPVTAVGIDISKPALEVFKINCFLKSGKIHPQSKISALKSDRLKEVNLADKYNLIISNPPYIPSDKTEGVHAGVLKWEPANALFIKREEYTTWFLDFFKQIFTHLENGGYFIMEGYEEELELLKPLLFKAKLTFVSIIKDYNNLDRILIAKKDEATAWIS